jgi:hypothetical protein
MSYEEKNITVSLMSSMLILGFYVINWFRMFQQGTLLPDPLFTLCGIVIAASIISNIAGNILTNIVLSIVHAIRTGGKEEPRFIADERDRLIELRGSKFSYITFSIGVLLAMLTFVFGQSPLIMFSMIVFFAIVAEVIGDIVQITLYRRGF